MINDLDVELGARGHREEEIGTDLSTLVASTTPYGTTNWLSN